MALAAADELRRRILSGEFPEGFQLKQDALAENFGMSRIPIREALVLLESEGFVRILPHRGAQFPGCRTRRSASSSSSGLCSSPGCRACPRPGLPPKTMRRSTGSTRNTAPKSGR